MGINFASCLSESYVTPQIPGCLVVSRPSGSRPDPIGESKQDPGRETIYTVYILYCTRTLIDLFFLRAVPVPVGIQTISVITKIILHIQRTTTGVVSITIYTHIQESLYLYYCNFTITKLQRLRKQRWRAPISESARFADVECPFLYPCLLLLYLHGLNTRAKLYA